MSQNSNSLLQLSWIPYVLILFEMLYMATPFAVFFYSIYELPLKFLNSSPTTAWMLQTVFPHFVETNSVFISILLSAGWLFMALGVLVFVIAFIQIYYAKFAKKGAVTNGLYRFIRHPQYTAWTLFGLGMCLVWSRIVVWMMFVTMTFIYYKLAKAEESECLKKFPDMYGDYLQKTGMFFPKVFMNTNHKTKASGTSKNPFFSQLMIYAATIAVTVLMALLLRGYTIRNIASISTDDYTAVSVTYINQEQIDRITELLFADAQVKNELQKNFSKNDRMMLYILPQNWSIEELGMENNRNHNNSHQGGQMSVSSHGNPKDTDTMKKRIIVSLAKVIDETNNGNLLYDIKKQVPKLYVDVDLEAGAVTNITKNLPQSIYGDIPVPMY